MKFNPFKSTSKYSEMLNKISLCTFIFICLALVYIRIQIPSINSFLGKIDEILKINLPFDLSLGTLLPSIIIAVFFRIIKLHDRISDLLKIRDRFDINEILFPLLIGSGVTLNISQIRKLKKDRIDLMYKTFYKYASSDPDKSVIDKHSITMALDQWCWYWIILEAIAVLLITSIIFAISGNFEISFIIVSIILVLIWFLQYIRSRCSTYALNEVELILDDKERKKHIAGVFNAL